MRSTPLHLLLACPVLSGLTSCGVQFGPDEVLYVFSPSPGTTYTIGDPVQVEASFWSCGERADASVDLYIDHDLVDRAQVVAGTTDDSGATSDRGTYRFSLPTAGEGALSAGNHSFRIEAFGTQANCWTNTDKTWELAHTFEFSVGDDGSSSEAGTTDGGTSDGGSTDGGTPDGGSPT